MDAEILPLLHQLSRDPFLDICSFVEDSKVKLHKLEKRAVVTKYTNINVKCIWKSFVKGKGKGRRFGLTGASQLEEFF